MATVEDDLIHLFHRMDIKTGSNKPRVIKAWFDTDCADLLKWMCSSITEENYLSNQEEYEYSQLEEVLTEEQLREKMASIDLANPGLFEYQDNLAETETLKHLVQDLEKREDDCDNLLGIHQRLNTSLENELLEVSVSKSLSEEELSSLQEKTVAVSQKLDKLYKEQIINHQDANRDQDPISTYVGYEQITELEDISNKISQQAQTATITQIPDDIAVLQKRIYKSKVSCLALETEVETMKSIENYLANNSFNSISSSVDHCTNTLHFKKQEQTLLLSAMEKYLLKCSEESTNKPMLEYYKNELKSYESRLNDLTTLNELVTQILSCLAIMYNLCLQEVQEINNVRSFFKSLIRDTQDSLFRKTKMVKIIDEYKIFQLQDFENKFKLMDSFGRFLLKPNEPLATILDKKCSIDHDIQTLQKLCFENLGCEEAHERARYVKTLENFLTNGPTCRVLSVPLQLQQVLRQVDKNIAEQDISLKSAMKAVKK